MVSRAPGHLTTAQTDVGTPLGATARRAGWAFVGIAAWQGLTFVTFAIAARVLPVDAYGQLLLVLTGPIAIGGFVGSALGLATMRYVGEWRATRPQQAADVITFTLSLSLIIGLAIGVAISASAEWIANSILHASHLSDEVGLVAPIPLLVAANGALTGCLSALNALRANAIANLVAGSVLLTLVVALVGALGSAGVILAFAVGLAAMGLGSYISLQRACSRWLIRPKLRTVLNQSRRVSQFAAPALLGSSMLQVTIWIATTQLVNGVGAYRAVALFQSVFRLEIGLTFVAFAIGQALLPALADEREQRTTTPPGLNIFASWMIGFPFLLTFISFPVLITIIFGKSLPQAGLATTTSLVLLGAGLFLFTDGLARLISVAQLMWWGFAINFTWALLVLVLNTQFASRGATGLASAFLLAYVVHTGIAITFAVRKHLIRLADILNTQSVVIWIVLLAAAAGTMLDAHFGVRIPLFVVGAAVFWSTGRKLIPNRPHDSTKSTAATKDPAHEPPIRIAIIGDLDLGRGTGGIENHVRAVTHELEQLGLEIQTFNHTSRVRSRTTSHRWPSARTELAKAYGRRVLSSFVSCRATVTRVQAWHPDIVWQHDLTASWLASRSLARKFPVVLTNHSAEYVTLMRYRVGRWLLHRMLAHYDAVIGTSLDRTPGWLGDRAHSIPNGVDAEVFTLRNEDMASLRIRLYGRDFSRVLLCPGRWAPIKGIYFLGKAVQTLEASGGIDPTTTAVVFAGNIPHDYPAYYQQVSQLLTGCRSTIIRLGDIRWAELASHYQAADLVVIPSLSEAVSLAALEAMASGTPVLGTSVGGLEQLIQQETTGYLVSPSSAEALANGIRHALTDPHRFAIATRGRSLAAEYSWRRTADQTIQVLRMACLDGEAPLRKRGSIAGSWLSGRPSASTTAASTHGY